MDNGKSGTCLNCGAPISGKFCAECGQKTDIAHKSLGKLLVDAFEEYLTVDNKFFKTLVPLLIKPGFLTNQYLAGRQKSFVPPFKMFLFSIILFVFVMSVVYPAVSSFLDLNDDSAGIVKIEMGDISTDPTDEGAAPTGQNDEEIQQAEGVARNLVDNLILSVQAVMILMVPVFAAFLKLLYIRWKAFYYVDHLVFSLHFHSFTFILFSVVSFLASLPVLNVVILAGPTIYLVIAQKRVYKRPWPRTIVKSLFGLGLYVIIAMLALGTVAMIKTVGFDIFFG